jgi:hypothetical protein
MAITRPKLIGGSRAVYALSGDQPAPGGPEALTNNCE